MKIKVIYKRWNESLGHICYISNTLENLQKLVGGYIEVVPIGHDRKDVIICNEEGKLKKLEKNFLMPFDWIRGDVVIIGTDGEEFCDVNMSLKEWELILDEWEKMFG